MTEVRIVVAEIAENSGRDLSVELALFPPGSEVRTYCYRGDTARLAAVCRDADAILTDFVPFTREVLSELRRCRVISVAATGWNCIDVEAAADYGISVCAIDEYCTAEVADHTLALLLALNRRLMEYHRQVQADGLWRFDTISGIPRLAGQTWGIIGLGRIGRAVARRAQAFGVTVVAHDPYVDSGKADGIELIELDDLLAAADIISLHCGLTDENNSFLDRSAFRRMRRQPVLINVARGGLVQEADLLEALEEGWISAAALDVLAQESPDLRGSGLLGRDNVILTPHVAFYSDASMLDNRRISAQNISRFLSGDRSGVTRLVHPRGSPDE